MTRPRRSGFDVLYVSRPFDDSYNGTGEQTVARETVAAMRRSGRRVRSVSRVFGTPEYHNLASLVVYDYVVVLWLLALHLVRPFTVVVFNSPFQTFLAPWFRLRRCRTVCVVNDMFHLDNTTKSTFDGYSARLHGRLGKVDLLVTTSTEVRDQIAADLGLSARVARLGVTVACARQDEGRKRQPPRIGYIGSYVERKRPEQLLALMEEPAARGWTWVLAGALDDQFRAQATRIAERAGVVLDVRGVVDDAGKGAFFADIDVLFFPTRLEGFGLPLVEAMRCGVAPVVLADAVIPSVVKSGCLVVEDTAEAANVIARLLDDPAASRAQQEVGRAYSDSFTWGGFAEALLTEGDASR